MILDYDFDDEDFDYEVDDWDILNTIAEWEAVRKEIPFDYEKEQLEELFNYNTDEYEEILDNYLYRLKKLYASEARELYDDYKAEQADPYGYRGINRNDIDGV